MYVSQAYFVIAMSVFFSHNLSNNSGSNYQQFFGKLNVPLRNLIPSEIWMSVIADVVY